MSPQRQDILHRTTLRGLEGRGGEPNPGPALIALLWTCLLLPDRWLQPRDSTVGSNCTRGFRVLVHGDAALPHAGCRSITGDDSRHTTPLFTFLSLPDSKLHGTHRHSGASWRRLAQCGYQRGRGRTDSGQGFSCFPRAAGVLPADPATHKADHTPQPWGAGVKG